MIITGDFPPSRKRLRDVFEQLAADLEGVVSLLNMSTTDTSSSL
jgi:hypothetical protein